jgi:hypothetical protein
MKKIQLQDLKVKQAPAGTGGAVMIPLIYTHPQPEKR